MAQSHINAVPAIVAKLQSGVTMTAIRAEYGAGPAIRQALWSSGYNTKGEKYTVAPIKGSNPKVLAKRVAEARIQGDSWGHLQLATGKDQDELKALLAKHGYAGELTEGRVIISVRKLKARAKAEAAQAAKPARKPRKRAAKKATEVVAA